MSEKRSVFAETIGVPSLLVLAGRALLMLASCVAAGTVLLTAVHCLPVERMRANVAANAMTFFSEGVHPCWDSRTTFAMLDNWTTMYMLEEAILPNTGSALRAAMLNERVATSVTTNLEARAVMDCFALAVTPPSEAQNASSIPREVHGRFWHGYLLWLKPALCIFRPSDLMVFAMALVMGLIIWLAIVSFRRCGLMGCVAAGAAVFILNPISSALCPNYYSEFVICLAGMAVVFQMWDWLQGAYRLPLFFFLVGCLTSFFTFLTFPLPLLALPVAVCSVLDAGRGREGAWAAIFMLCLAFSGYASMWIAKWLVGSALTGVNLLADGVGRTFFRISGDAQGSCDPGALAALRGNLRVFWTRPLLLIMAILALFSLGWLCANIRHLDRRRIPTALCLGVLSVLPFVWIALVRQHSLIHSFMVHKIFSLTAFCLLAIPWVLCGQAQEKSPETRECQKKE